MMNDWSSDEDDDDGEVFSVTRRSRSDESHSLTYKALALTLLM